jgi:hypothetical protein
MSREAAIDRPIGGWQAPSAQPALVERSALAAALGQIQHAPRELRAFAPQPLDGLLDRPFLRKDEQVAHLDPKHAGQQDEGVLRWRAVARLDAAQETFVELAAAGQLLLREAALLPQRNDSLAQKATELFLASEVDEEKQHRRET